MPAKSRWFIAILVQELRVSEATGNVVWRNFHLVHANSPEAAYRKANRIGESLQGEWRNSEKQAVRSRFRGVSDLVPIYEELADGAEILFESRENLTQKQIEKMVRGKRGLAAFQAEETGRAAKASRGALDGQPRQSRGRQSRPAKPRSR